jgi:hypothetical protein
MLHLRLAKRAKAQLAPCVDRRIMPETGDVLSNIDRGIKWIVRAVVDTFGNFERMLLRNDFAGEGRNVAVDIHVSSCNAPLSLESWLRGKMDDKDGTKW